MPIIEFAELPDDILCMIFDLLDPLSYECFRRVSSRTRRIVREVYDTKPNSVADMDAALEAISKQSTKSIQVCRLVDNLNYNFHLLLDRHSCSIGDHNISNIIPIDTYRDYLAICDTYTKEMCKYYRPDTQHDLVGINQKVHEAFSKHAISTILNLLFYESRSFTPLPSVELYAHYDKYMSIIIRLRKIYDLGLIILRNESRTIDKARIDLINHYYYPEYYLPVLMFIDACATIQKFSRYYDLKQYVSYIHPTLYETHDCLEHLHCVVNMNGLDINDYLKSSLPTELAKDSNYEEYGNGGYTTAEELMRAQEKILHHINNYLPATRLPYH